MIHWIQYVFLFIPKLTVLKSPTPFNVSKSLISLKLQPLNIFVDATLFFYIVYFQSFVHISTAYSNPNRKEIEERVYPLGYDPENIVYCMETLPNKITKVLNKELLVRFETTLYLLRNDQYASVGLRIWCWLEFFGEAFCILLIPYEKMFNI